MQNNGHVKEFWNLMHYLIFLFEIINDVLSDKWIGRIIFLKYFKFNFCYRRDFSIGTAVKNAVGNVIGSCVFELDELIGAFGTQIQLPLR